MTRPCIRGELRRLMLTQLAQMRQASLVMVEPMIELPDGGTVLALERIRYELIELETAIAAVLAAISAAEPAARAHDARARQQAITRLESANPNQRKAA